MKITIEGKPKELKKLLNAIGSSKEQSKAVVPADKIKDFKPSPYSFIIRIGTTKISNSTSGNGVESSSDD